MQAKTSNFTVVITRPIESANRLESAFLENGIPCTVIPLIELEAETAKLILPPSNIALFISPSSVEFATKKFPDLLQWLDEQKTIAVGQGTKAALKKLSVNQVQTPTHASTEGLIELFQDNLNTSQKVTLFKGHNGRDELERRLNEMGYQVTPINLYKRQPITYEQFSDHSDFLFLVSSEAAIRALRRNTQKNVKVITTSQRLKTIAAEAGFSVAIQVESADNHVLVEQLLTKLAD